MSLRSAIGIGNHYEGNIYWAREQNASGNFGFLRWAAGGSSRLNESLIIPGNFDTEYPGSDVDMNTVGDPLPPGEISGDGDGVLEKQEWLNNETGNVASTEKILDSYIDKHTPVVLMVFDETNADLLTEDQRARGDNLMYKVYEFIQVRLLGYSFQGGVGNDETPSPKWIMFEYVTSDVECGGEENPPPQDDP